MLRFLDRLDALSLNLIWNFETTSNAFWYAGLTPHLAKSADGSLHRER
jgi:hypothetical protein